MTDRCSGGTSAPRAGAPEFVAVATGMLSALFQARGGKFLTMALPFLQLPTIELAPFCASPQPTVADLTADEANALLKVQWGSSDWNSAIEKLKTMALAVIWDDFCECTSGTRVPFVPPVQPSGTVTIVNDPIGLPTACDVQTSYFPGDQVAGDYAVQIWNGHLHPPPGNLETQFQVTVRMTIDIDHAAGWVGPMPDLRVQVQYHGGGNVEPPIPLGQGLHFEWTHTTTQVDRGFGLVWFDIIRPTLTFHADVANAGVTTKYEVFCSPLGSGGIGPEPCCPPDEATSNRLDAILSMVTLLQRQLAPFAHILGESNAVTGRGTIGVQGLLGVKVDLTSIPDSYGVAVGSPDAHFDVGWLSISTADGLLDQHRITAALETWFPRSMSDATILGYSLAPGVTATITSVVREG
jgi:hypothetical protein